MNELLLRMWVLSLMLMTSVVGACRGSQSSHEGARLTEAAAPVPAAEAKAAREVEKLEFEVIRELPHSTAAYTQGLLLHAGLAYESRGQYGRSGIDVWEPASGSVVRSVDLEPELFGEGLTRVGDTLWQATWQSGRALRWSLNLELLGEAAFFGEGWGLEFDGQRLILSDGTHELRFYDPETFDYLGKLAVRRGSGPQDQLNELEYVAQEEALYANVYQTDEIVRIDMGDGSVTGAVDLRGLLTRAEARRADVLNGIAYWPERGSFLVTGKHWPKSFEIVFK